MEHIGTRPIETQRLLLRRFVPEDAQDVFDRWSSDPEVSRYMRWLPMLDVSEAQVAMARWQDRYQQPDTYYWAVTRKEDGRPIGAISIKNVSLHDGTCETGYCIGRAYWGRGYVTEALRAVIHFALWDLGLNRVAADHVVDNPASGAVMRKAGMRLEGRARQLIRCMDGLMDCDLYAVLKEDLYQPAPFVGFYQEDLPADGELSLVCAKAKSADPDKGHVPAYAFDICLAGAPIGHISLRIGMSDRLYYGGHIGYDVQEAHRGHGYAARACALLLPVLRYHGFTQVLITNRPDNAASARVCEKLGARMLRIAPVPAWHDLYESGARQERIWVWQIG